VAGGRCKGSLIRYLSPSKVSPIKGSDAISDRWQMVYVKNGFFVTFGARYYSKPLISGVL